MFTRLMAVACGAVIAAALTACSSEAAQGTSDEAAGAAAGDESVNVVAEDIRFPQETYQATAGDVTFSYENNGATQHTLLIEGVEGFKLEVAESGDVDEGSAPLQAGMYTLYCDVPGHREAGMEAVLEVQ